MKWRFIEKGQYKVWLAILSVIILTIAFESSQQLYYVKRYNLNPEVEYLDLFKNHAYRWVIWLILAIPLFRISKKLAFRSFIGTYQWIKPLLTIAVLIVCNIVIISGIAWWIASLQRPNLEGLLYFQEFIPFFTYQKLPIYSLGYIGLLVILIFYFRNQSLEVKVEKINQSNAAHFALVKKLKQSLQSQSQILSIKIGNKHKIIPVEEIVRIESNDYCVNIFPESGRSYAMRISLKALENQLPGHFIRVHRQHIVNMRKVREFRSGAKSHIGMDQDIQIPVSKSKIQGIRNYLQQMEEVI